MPYVILIPPCGPPQRSTHRNPVDPALWHPHNARAFSSSHRHHRHRPLTSKTCFWMSSAVLQSVVPCIVVLSCVIHIPAQPAPNRHIEYGCGRNQNVPSFLKPGLKRAFFERNVLLVQGLSRCQASPCLHPAVTTGTAGTTPTPRSTSWLGKVRRWIQSDSLHRWIQRDAPSHYPQEHKNRTLYGTLI